VPLDDLTSVEPKETGPAKAPASKDPVAPRTKPIVFWGVWIYFGPTAVGAWILAYTSLVPIFDPPQGDA
jgi:hypothetical protein